METITVHKNEKREIVKIQDVTNNKHVYAWIEENKLTVEETPYLPEKEKLVFTIEDLKNLFPSLTIESQVKRKWNNRKCCIEFIPFVRSDLNV